jgi:hypothetical protein
MVPRALLLLSCCSLVAAQPVFKTLHTFPNSSGPVQCTLTEVNPGEFVGCHGGEIFRLTSAGGFTVFAALSSSVEGTGPIGQLVAASDGLLYGSTVSDGRNPAISGTTFAVSPSGSVGVVSDSYSYPSALIEGAYGNLYGSGFDGVSAYYGAFSFSLAARSPSFYGLPAGTFVLAHPQGPLLEVLPDVFMAVEPDPSGQGNYSIDEIEYSVVISTITPLLPGEFPAGGLAGFPASGAATVYGATQLRISPPPCTATSGRYIPFQRIAPFRKRGF